MKHHRGSSSRQKHSGKGHIRKSGDSLRFFAVIAFWVPQQVWYRVVSFYADSPEDARSFLDGVLQHRDSRARFLQFDKEDPKVLTLAADVLHVWPADVKVRLLKRSLYEHLSKSDCLVRHTFFWERGHGKERPRGFSAFRTR